MKIALIPDRQSHMNNRIFAEEEVLSHRDSILVPMLEVKNLFLEKGIEFNTIDCYENLREVDWFIFHKRNPEWLLKIIKNGLQNRTIYVAYEPEVVDPLHSKKGIRLILKNFAYIATWNRELVDEVRIFELHGPYFIKKLYDGINDQRDKILTFIFSNKSSKAINQQYSLRREVIDYFERHKEYPFDFYGVGWGKEKLSNYAGEIANKNDIYKDTKFAICFENIGGTNGGISEKIFDCLNSGTIPIYCGDNCIAEYIPADCYIDYHKFKSVAEMADYIYHMDNAEYLKYRKNMYEFYKNIDSVEDFTAKGYCTALERIFLKGYKNYRYSLLCVLILKLHCLYRKMKRRK